MDKNKRFKLIFIIMGVASLGWFLIRVIPKPSRAAYPCMRATFPIASGFIVYILSITSSWILLRYLKKKYSKSHIILASAFLIFTLLVVTSGVFLNSMETKGSPSVEAFHEPNAPIGNAVGIFPGRVVWVWNRFATNENCTNSVNKNGTLGDDDNVWYQEKNTDQLLVTQMISTGIQRLTEKTTDVESWDEIFKFHNKTRGKGETGYVKGEKILLKLNRTSSSAGSNIMNINTMHRKDTHSRIALSETSPQIVLAVLRHLVYKAGVPQNAIYVGDLQRNHYQDEYEKYTAEFPQVNFLGNNIYQTDIKIVQNGRKALVPSDSPLIFYSDNGTVMTGAVSDKLYSIYEEIEYLINLPMMKGHATGGITVFPKNHFGSHTRMNAQHLHPGLILDREGYGKYRVQVDIMGSNYLGKKNLVYILDALYCGPTWGDDPVKFEMPPFNDDWTSSIFFSFDMVAIESVAFDFLRTEFNGKQKYVKDADAGYPNFIGCDDYMHQAASDANWPAGIVYAPNGDGVRIPSSLGVHEHWNNATDKKYSVNLGTGNGIELVPLLVENHAPYQHKEFGLFQLTQLNEEITLIENLDDYFKDYENDLISYTVTSENDNLKPSLSGKKLSVNLRGSVQENFKIRVEASDGKESFASLLFIEYNPQLGLHAPKALFSVHPNPVENLLYIHNSRINSRILDIHLYDLNGKMVYANKLEVLSDVTSLDISHLNKGSYILELASDAGKEKLVILKK